MRKRESFFYNSGQVFALAQENGGQPTLGVRVSAVNEVSSYALSSIIVV